MTLGKLPSVIYLCNDIEVDPKCYGSSASLEAAY